MSARRSFKDVFHVEFPDAEQMSVPGVYLVHMQLPLRHAQHYIGYADDIARRIQDHLDQIGTPILKAASRAGIVWEVARIWPHQDRAFERSLKQAKQTRQFCPVCIEERRRRSREAMRRKRRKTT